MLFFVLAGFVLKRHALKYNKNNKYDKHNINCSANLMKGVGEGEARQTTGRPGSEQRVAVTMCERQLS